MPDLQPGPAGAEGSNYLVQHTEREVTVYVLSESDLDRLSDLNTNATVFTSAAAFFGGLWLDLFKDVAFATTVPESTELALRMVQPILVILALGFAILAAVFWIKRGNLAGKIKRDSRTKGSLRGEIRPPSTVDDAGGSP